MGFSEGNMISASCDCTDVAFNTSKSVSASINITVPMITSADSSQPETAPLCLVAVIDISYSMMGDRLLLAKKTLEFIVNNLSSRDRFAIVTFGSSSETVFPLTAMSDNSRQTARDKIESIKVNGCTNLSDGLFKGISWLTNAPPDNTYSVMLMTDGQANAGITSSNSLVSTLEQKISALDHDVSVFTFGYGSDHNAQFLRAISDSTNGMYYFIEKTEQIREAFAECLGGVASVALQNAVLEITTCGSNTIKSILADVPQKRTNNSHVLQIGNLSCGERRNIPIEVNIEKLQTPNPSTNIFMCNFIFQTTSGEEKTTCTLSLARPKPEDCKNEKSSNYIEIDEQRNRVKVAEVLKDVITYGEQGNFSKAKTELNDLLSQLTNSPSSQSNFTKSLLSDVNDAIGFVDNPAKFKSVGIKYLYSLSRSHYQQRACGISGSAASAYLTEGQKSMLQSLTGGNVSKSNNSAVPAKVNSVIPAKPVKHDDVSNEKKNEEPENTASVEPVSSVSNARLGRGIRRLMSDFAEIKKHPLPSVVAEPLESDVFEWHCNMEGPSGSPYHKIVFHIIMQFPHTYPFQPPKLYFCSYLAHEHVFKTWICLDMLQEFEWSSKNETDTPYTGWTTAYSVHSVLLQLQSFLFDKANMDANEVKKAADEAKKFVCTGCFHKGTNPYPKLVRNVQLSNPFTSISIPSARVKTYRHQEKEIPQLCLDINIEQMITGKISENETVSNINEKSTDNNNDDNDADDWNVVVSKSKKKSNSSKQPKIKTKNSKATSAIQTTNRFIVEKPIVSIQEIIEDSDNEEEKEEVVEKIEEKNNNNSSKLSSKNNNIVVVLKSDNLQEIAENEKKVKACRKKNAKRREKRKRLKEEQAKAELEAKRAIQLAKLVEEEETRKVLLKAAEEKEKKIKEARANSKFSGYPSTLSEALSLSKPSGRGLHFSLFIYCPESIIEEIFSYLTVPDLVSVGSCCRVFYRLANSNNIWKNLCFRYFPNSRNDPQYTTARDPKILFGREVLATKAQLFCFHTRQTFEDDILGIPISYKRNPRTKEIQYISTTLDLLSKDAFQGDKVRKSVWKRPFTHWMPLYITPTHFQKSEQQFQNAIARLCDSNTFKPWMILDVIPKLMNTMVVSVMSGETHASIVALEGYCAFHHILLKMIEKYPKLSERIDSKISDFIKDERQRTKDNCPSLGDFIPLLAVSENYCWNDVRSAYVQENFDRNALWVIKQYPRLKNPDRGYGSKQIKNMDRLSKTFDANRTSMRLLMFHVYFLTKIARPNGRSLKEVTSNYDLFYGRPTSQMKEDLQNYCKNVLDIDGWPGLFRMIGMNPPTPQSVTFVLNQAMVNSKRKGYHH